MADPFDKAIRGQTGDSDVIDEFVLPKAGPERGGVLGIGKVRDDILVRIRKGGAEFYLLKPGEPPERVVPTDDELKYAQSILDSRRKADTPEKPKPSPADKLEPIKDPRTGQPIGLRDPATGDKIDLPDRTGPTATTPSTSAPHIVMSDGTTKPNPNYQPPEKIRTGKMAPIGPEGQQAPEVVSPAQAEYDYRAASDEYARERQKVLDAIAREKIGADEAWRRLSAIREGIALKLQESQLALTARGQDISARNADLDAGTSQRGQDLGFASGMARGAESLAAASLDHLAPAGTRARHQYILRHGTDEGAPSVQNTPFPYDPRTFGLGVAQQAMQMAPPMVMGQPVPPASLPNVAPAYDQAAQQYILGAKPRYVMGQ